MEDEEDGRGGGREGSSATASPPQFQNLSSYSNEEEECDEATIPSYSSFDSALVREECEECDDECDEAATPS